MSISSTQIVILTYCFLLKNKTNKNNHQKLGALGETVHSRPEAGSVQKKSETSCQKKNKKAMESYQGYIKRIWSQLEEAPIDK